jgi:hypothetical protein
MEKRPALATRNVHQVEASQHGEVFMSTAGRVTALVAALTLVACHHDGVEPIGEHPFEGEYRWTYSQGGIAGIRYTPESTGYTARLEFDGHGEVSAFRGETRVARATYVAEPTTKPDGSTTWHITYTPPLPIFTFASFEEQTVRIVGKVILEFTDPCCDRYVHLFQKPFVR